jgi:SAM-dependent methyltransferase
LPFEDGTFDAALAQLVVQFMADPLQGVREMARVTRAGGVVAACVWDVAGAAPMTPFWHAVRELELTRHTEDDRVGTREGDLARLFADAGLDDVRATTLVVHAVHPTFDEWWEPFTLGVGPAGSYYQQLEPAQQAELEARLRERMGDRIELDTRAWTARGTKGV